MNFKVFAEQSHEHVTPNNMGQNKSSTHSFVISAILIE